MKPSPVRLSLDAPFDPALERAGPGLQQDLSARTQSLIDRLNGHADAHRMPVRFTRAGSFFAIAMTQSRIAPAAVTLLSYMLLTDGIYLRPGDRGGFLTVAHGENDLQTIAEAFERALSALRRGGQV